MHRKKSCITKPSTSFPMSPAAAMRGARVRPAESQPCTEKGELEQTPTPKAIHSTLYATNNGSTSDFDGASIANSSLTE
jgi:hypothetical protein